MEKFSTKKIFEDLTHKTVSEAEVEEVEGNLREYFSILVEWIEVSKKKEKESKNG